LQLFYPSGYTLKTELRLLEEEEKAQAALKEQLAKDLDAVAAKEPNRQHDMNRRG